MDDKNLMRNIIEDLQRKVEEKEINERNFTYAAAKAAIAGKKEFTFQGKKHPVKMSKDKAEKIISEIENDLNEKRKRKVKKRRKKTVDRKKLKNYFQGTRASNKSMAREINKCAKTPRPKSCYDYWDADKKYDKSKKKNESEENEFLNILKEFIELEEKRKRKAKKKKPKIKKLSAKTRETLKNKAKNANMPLGALTSVYRKGLAAWLTGHRQGVAQHQWAMARVNSFIRGGKTRSVDKGEWKKVQNHRKKK